MCPLPFQHDQPRLQLEGGLRGVTGTFGLCEREAVYIEAWLPEDVGADMGTLPQTGSPAASKGLRCGDAWYGTPGQIEELSLLRQGHETTPYCAEILHTAHASSTVQTSPIAAEPTAPDAFSSMAVPVLHEDRVVVVFLFLYAKGTLPEEGKIEKLRGDLTVAVDNVIRGTEMHAPEDCLFADLKVVFKGQLEKVLELLRKDNIYSEATLAEEVRSFYSLGISSMYFSQNGPEQLAKHLSSFIGVKKADFGTISLQHTTERDACFFCLDAPEERSALVTKLNEFVDANEDEKTTCSVTVFTSKHEIADGKRLVMGLATKSRFNTTADTTHTVLKEYKEKSTIWDVASASFLRTRSTFARNEYDAILAKSFDTLHPISDVTKRKIHPGYKIRLAYPQGAPEGCLEAFYEYATLLGFEISQVFCDSFSHGTVTYSAYVTFLGSEKTALTEEEIETRLTSFVRRLVTLSVLPRPAYMNRSKEFGPRAKLYLGCAQIFTYHFMQKSSEDFMALRRFLIEKNVISELDRLDRLGKTMLQDAVTVARFNETMQKYSTLAWSVYDHFIAPRRPANGAETLAKSTSELQKIIKNTVVDPIDQDIFGTMLVFNESVLKTNFFSAEKAATSFRLDPALFISDTVYPEVPYAIVLICGASFEGFHIRFRDIARGGIRLIRSPNSNFFQNQQTLFEENYNLAYTQQLKNKDIPEGGSKGTILLNPEKHQKKGDYSYKAYMDSLIDLALVGSGYDPEGLQRDVVDLLKKPEIYFFGPDEGTAGDVVVWAAKHAHTRGYRFWKSITTGKPATMGGIPHDTYGMTTRSVHEQVKGLLRTHNLEEQNITKFQTGGPDGDLGSNEILISKDATIGIVDGSGVVFDPKGLNRTELLRLATARKMIDNFDVSLLSASGYRVLIQDTNVTLPDGEFVESGLHFRNEYHLHGSLRGDLFVPCGGRPNAVNINNVSRMFLTNADGRKTPKFRFICEGANLFFTRDARRVLEDAGVVLIKDATCNKGGVTSSSLEVLAALAMTEEQHSELMCVSEKGVPEFYRTYVTQVQEKIEMNAQLEFGALWRERQRYEATGSGEQYLAEITDALSKKINSLNDRLQVSAIFRNESLRQLVLTEALPALLLNEVGLDNIIARVPESYIMAICGAHFASKYVYEHGLEGSEVDVLDFVQKYIRFA